MKKFGKLIKYIAAALILLLTCATFAALSACAEKNTQYLRIHIRANSNSREDQDVKYAVKDAVVEYLTPQLEEANTMSQALDIVQKNLPALNELCSSVLLSEGFSYGASARTCREQFPARTYGSLTLSDGVYDALIIELGSGSGDNWWCVVYPPLCFTGDSGAGYVYKSKIMEIIDDFFSRNKEEK